MIEKLRSHLRKSKGFTLVELLVVIAIIAILVVIVIVAINPVQRLADAADRRAAANVRSAGTLVQTCITAEQSLPTPGAITGCIPTGVLGTYGNVPATVAVRVTTAGGDVCAWQQGATGGTTPHWYVYRATTTNGTVVPGVVSEQAGVLGAGDACP